MLAALAWSPGAGPGDRCTEPLPDSASPDLYCIHLIAAPGVDSVSGHVVLDFVPGPFTISVTRDGVQRYRPTIVIAGLPQPSVLDSTATTYVAWVTTPRYAEFVNLGAVTNGSSVLSPVEFDQFVIVVSAESSAEVRERTGRIVLRGGSPSTRLQPPDIQQFALAVTGNADTMTGHDHAAGKPGDPLRWPGVPMPAGIAMLPSEMALRPPVAPMLPAPAGLAVTSRRSTVLRLANGDTLSLVAGRVQRQIHGREYTMYAFNGESPGPLLSVTRGATVTVQFTNALDVPTTVHWHGLRLDWRMDGVPHLSQEPVPPGGHFTYTLTFPDDGVYWYHPHVREDMQQDLGLAGNILVRSAPATGREEIVMLDDLLVGEDGLVPFGAEHATHALMGRFGNVFLVNGEPRWAGSARAGETVRFWFTNAANTRTFNLSVTNATMRLVASDLGAYDQPVPVESVVIAPAERYAVDVTFGGGVAAVENRVRALDHVFGRFIPQVDTLGVVRVGGSARAEAPVSRSTATVPLTVPTGEPDLTLAFGVRMTDLPYVTSRMMLLDSAYFHPVEWSGTMVGMNWATTGSQAHWFVRDVASGRENEAIDYRVRQGDRRRIRLVNQRGSVHAMHHPIHLHGQRFMVLSVNGVAPAARVWKDTILLPAGAVADILVEFDNPGRWMLHCHIAEHVESGMMTTLTVESR
ncbi:MAG: multicopper oxidase family protein [Gemmatimonadales bacterium]